MDLVAIDLAEATRSSYILEHIILIEVTHNCLLRVLRELAEQRHRIHICCSEQRLGGRGYSAGCLSLYGFCLQSLDDEKEELARLIENDRVSSMKRHSG